MNKVSRNKIFEEVGDVYLIERYINAQNKETPNARQIYGGSSQISYASICLVAKTLQRSTKPFLSRPAYRTAK